LRPVLRIDAPLDEARSEPLLPADPASVPPADQASNSGPIADDIAGDRREPAAPDAAPASPPPERAPPVGSRQRTGPFGPIGSLVLHLLPLLLLLNWSMRPPAEAMPIPVRLVFPPPPPPTKPRAVKPLAKPAVRPPPGRLASDDIGDTKTHGHDPAKSEAVAADKPATARTPPPEPEQKTAAAVPPPVPGASDLPNEKPVHDPPRPKPKPTVPQPLLRRAAARIHFAARPAQFPGPAATRDEYLAYLKYLTLKHLNMLTMSMVAGRRGQTVIDILVLDDGTVATLKVGQSSGYPDIDRQIEAMIQAVGRFPPLPQWFQGPSMRLEFRIKFPEALED
jgi:TonB family protein